MQCMMKMPGQTFLDPPLIYLKKMDDTNYKYNSREKHQDIFEFSERIANGEAVVKSEFKKYKKNKK